MSDQQRHLLPELMKFVCDPHLDAMTRSWIFDALRDITGEDIGDDPQKWHSWYLRAKGVLPAANQRSRGWASAHSLP